MLRSGDAIRRMLSTAEPAATEATQRIKACRQVAAAEITEGSIVTHSIGGSVALQERVRDIADRIRSQGNSASALTSERLELLDQLQSFSLGRFLITHGGMDASNAFAVFTWPDQRANLEASARPIQLQPLESFLLNRSPTILGLQHQHATAKLLLGAAAPTARALGSVPCRLFEDFTGLDWTSDELAGSRARLYGADLDPCAVRIAAQRAAEAGLEGRAKVFHQDAWGVSLPEQLDALATTSLTDYEPDDTRAVALLQGMRASLRSGGKLFAGFLTPPPALSAASPWDMACVDAEDALMEAVLLHDIIGVRWHGARSADQMADLLHRAGFSSVDFDFGPAGIAPTAIARA
ncbi:hypothetical protein FNF27_03278 [Cafeteria roenbergensis]|nr:hypothetical protein FNF29_04249 [Cafeteria roenbergensis]KAA0162926.1 hypothetical protein FNF28_04482 [Cafeteria roenbergensis]KAA0164775.1 hypothetical protein FNF31_02312 [Cafeteria roenbergensis]KAA0175270.1 hypothetical protein FNF27_03278 [Cafeteria roenbergensis]|eukprot:KAA0151843.1 hypothetical protein FNF29_04249 [Cafeteria roenbergensis]